MIVSLGGPFAVACGAWCLAVPGGGCRVCALLACYWALVGGWACRLAVSGWGLPWLPSCICGVARMAGLALGDIYNSTFIANNPNYMLNSGRKILVVVTLQ